MRRLTPPRLLILSFLFVIFIGTILLCLPISVNADKNISIIDSLFTATSATCVTGLVVVDTGTFFSSFGKWVIFALFQVGGLGIITFSTLFAVMLGRRISFRETDVIKNTLDSHNIISLRKLIIYIVCITFFIELLGSCFLFFRWHFTQNWDIFYTIEQSVFHSVSAFCNAGFSLFKTNLINYNKDPYINIIIMLLIFLGGIGFIVIMDIIGLFFKKKSQRKFSLQTKIVFYFSIFLIIFGALFIFIFEKNNTMKDMSISSSILGSFFHSVSARTAGFNTLVVGNFSFVTLFLIIILMFIGGSPGSAAGGIKTCTFIVILFTVISMLKNKRRVMIYNRSIPQKIIRKAIVIIFLSLIWIIVITMILLYVNSDTLKKNDSIKYLFEVVSAFGTVGLSTGITDKLNLISKICIIITMFVGRVGTLTLALAVAFKEKKETYIFPEENIMVG